MKKHGYLDENGKVTKSVRRELVRNIRHSQNEESKVILKNTNYGQVSKDALQHTSNAIWRIVAGQILYYAAPPVIYEVKVIMIDKHINLDNALEKLGKAGKRIGEYVYANLKNIFKGVYGVPIYTYMRIKKMQSAALLLIHTERSVAEIAYEFGYNNTSKFTAAFQKVMGETPSEYRKVHAKTTARQECSE